MSSNIKPKWEDAPEWANYAAMDIDGKWWWYENKPEIIEDNWILLEGRFDLVIYDNWQESLEERP